MTMPFPVSGVGFGRILHKIHTARKTNSGVVYKRSGGALEYPNQYEMNPFLFWNWDSINKFQNKFKLRVSRESVRYFSKDWYEIRSYA